MGGRASVAGRRGLASCPPADGGSPAARRPLRHAGLARVLRRRTAAVFKRQPCAAPSALVHARPPAHPRIPRHLTPPKPVRRPCRPPSGSTPLATPSTPPSTARATRRCRWRASRARTGACARARAAWRGWPRGPGRGPTSKPRWPPLRWPSPSASARALGGRARAHPHAAAGLGGASGAGEARPQRSGLAWAGARRLLPPCPQALAPRRWPPADRAPLRPHVPPVPPARTARGKPHGTDAFVWAGAEGAGAADASASSKGGKAAKRGAALTFWPLPPALASGEVLLLELRGDPAGVSADALVGSARLQLHELVARHPQVGGLVGGRVGGRAAAWARRARGFEGRCPASADVCCAAGWRGGSRFGSRVPARPAVWSARPSAPTRPHTAYHPACAACRRSCSRERRWR